MKDPCLKSLFVLLGYKKDRHASPGFDEPLVGICGLLTYLTYVFSFSHVSGHLLITSILFVTSKWSYDGNLCLGLSSLGARHETANWVVAYRFGSLYTERLGEYFLCLSKIHSEHVATPWKELHETG